MTKDQRTAITIVGLAVIVLVFGLEPLYTTPQSGTVFELFGMGISRTVVATGVWGLVVRGYIPVTDVPDENLRLERGAWLVIVGALLGGARLFGEAGNDVNATWLCATTPIAGTICDVTNVDDVSGRSCARVEIALPYGVPLRSELACTTTLPPFESMVVFVEFLYSQPEEICFSETGDDVGCDLQILFE